MKSQWFGIVLVAALMIGYSLLGNLANDGFDSPHDQPVLLGYYLKDAIIVETSELGTPRVRFAASEVTQDPQDNSVAMTAVRGDYMWPTTNRDPKHARTSTNHWVLNADQAHIPAKSKETAYRIELRGNVDAHSVAAAHNVALTTSSLDIDTDQQVARTEELVRVDIDGHSATGRGLLADLQTHRVQLQNSGTLQLAATTRDAPIAMPDVWEWATFTASEKEILLMQVRSKREPLIAADRARAMGTDVGNNQWVLTGAVRLQLAHRGLLAADAATVTVRNDTIVFAKLSGAPIKFEYQPQDSNQIVNGTAKNIDYDVPTQILRFYGDAWFSNGKFELKSDFQYNLNTGEASGTRGTGGLVSHTKPTELNVEPKE